MKGIIRIGIGTFLIIGGIGGLDQGTDLWVGSLLILGGIVIAKWGEMAMNSKYRNDK